MRTITIILIVIFSMGLIRPVLSSDQSSIPKKRLLAKITHTPKFDLPSLKDLAKKNNPTLVQAEAQIKGEKGKALQAGLWPNPSIQSAGELLGERRAGLGEFLGRWGSARDKAWR